MDFSVFPVPRRMTTTSGSLHIFTASWVVAETIFSDRFQQHLFRFMDEVKDRFTGPLKLARSFPQAGDVWLVIRLDAALTSGEEYRIREESEKGKSRLYLEAGGEAGAFYGLQTLAQLVNHTDKPLPAFSIEDAPDFPKRGVCLDLSRGRVPKLDSLKTLIRIFARLKINQLQLYIEHTFAFSAHREVWFEASPLGAGEIMELDSYCRLYYIELVPNFNSFGHFERWLKHPAYHYLAESPNGFVTDFGHSSPYGSTLCPDDTSLSFLDTLYAEYLPNFTSPLFNVGLDETWELGQGKSKERCEKEGVLSVYLDFLNRIRGLVTKHGRKMMFWADMICKKPELVDKLPRDITAMIWGYEKDHPFREQANLFATAGIPFYVCPGTSSWNSLSGRTDNCLANLRQAAETGLEQGACGYLITDWGDNGHHQQRPVSYAGFAAGAGHAWNSKKVDTRVLAHVLDRFFFHPVTGSMGRLWLELGEVQNALTPPGLNESGFHRLLFHKPDGRFSIKQLNSCLERLRELKATLAGVSSRGREAELCRREFLNTTDMVSHALQRGLLFQGSTADKRKLREQIRRIIPEYAKLWLYRNRPGGLRESLAYLEKCLRDLG